MCKVWYLFWIWEWGFDRNAIVAIMRCPFYAARTSSNHHHVWNRGYETLKKQWMTRLIPQHPYFHPEVVPKIEYFVWNLRVIFDRYVMIWTIKCFYLMSGYHLIMHICQSKVMKQSSSNGCLSLQHIILFSVPRGCSQSDIIFMNLGIGFWQECHCGNHEMPILRCQNLI